MYIFIVITQYLLLANWLIYLVLIKNNEFSWEGLILYISWYMVEEKKPLWSFLVSLMCSISSGNRHAYEIYYIWNAGHCHACSDPKHLCPVFKLFIKQCRFTWSRYAYAKQLFTHLKHKYSHVCGTNSPEALQVLQRHPDENVTLADTFRGLALLDWWPACVVDDNIREPKSIHSKSLFSSH